MLAVTGQIAITTTATPQQLPNQPLVNGISFSAKTGNTASVVFGNASSVSATTGFIVAAGTSTPFIPMQGGNLNEVWVVGTAADVFSYIGA